MMSWHARGVGLVVLVVLGVVLAAGSAVQAVDRTPTLSQNATPLPTTVSMQPTPTQAVTPSIPRATPTPLLSPTPQAYTEWFHVQPQVAAAWMIAHDAQDVWTLTPRDAGAANGALKRVLVIYTKQSSAYDTAISTLLTVFGDKHVAASFTAVNFWGEPAQGQRTLAWAVAQRFDLIFAMGSDATAFLSAQFNHGSIPVVSVSAKDPVLLGQMRDYATGSGTNIAYTSLNMQIEVQMTYLKALKPDLQNIVVLYAASNASAIQTQVEPLRRIVAGTGIRIIDVVVDDDKRAQAELAAKLPLAIAQIATTDPNYANSLVWITGSTSVFDQIETINQHAGMIPVLSAVPDVVQAGDASAVLSIGVSFASNAHLAAVYGVAILTGSARAGDLKVGTISPPDIAINFRRARAIGLKIPFRFFESASIVYDSAGVLVRNEGEVVRGPSSP